MTWAVVYDLRLHTTSMPVNAGDVGTREKSCPHYKTAVKGMVPDDFLQLMLPQEILWKEKKRGAVSNFTSAGWREILHGYRNSWDN